MSLTVKAYFEREGGEPEIRRFAVDEGVSSSYQYLISKIQQVFGARVTRESVDLFWKVPENFEANITNSELDTKTRKRKAGGDIEYEYRTISLASDETDREINDSDGDKVAFSSDEELTDALGYVSDGVFRIFIRPKASTFKPTNDGDEHPGVVCDGCNNTIRGSRFKCMECPDFDLCTVCENRGEHGQHRMVRLRNPGMSPLGFEMGGGFPFGPHCGPPPPGPPPGPHGRHGPHQGPHHPPPQPPMGPWGGFGGGPAWPFRKMMKRCWRQWMRNMMQANDPNMYEQNRTESDDEMNRCKEPRKDDSAKEGRREKESMQRESQESGKSDRTEEGQDERTGPNEEYLRNVGESVAAMLDPLGISVDVDVEHTGKRKRCHGGRRGRGGMRGRGWGGMWAPWGGMFGGMGRGGWPGPYWNEQGPEQHQQYPGEPRPGTSKDSSHDEPRPDEPRPDEPRQEASANEKEPTAPSPVDVQMNSPSHQTESDGEWMVLNKDKGTNEMEANPASPQAPREEPPIQMYPNLEAQHPDTKINEALKQLLAMGFNNDGGWLVSLLEAKGGDLNKTLDALRPHKPK